MTESFTVLAVSVCMCVCVSVCVFCHRFGSPLARSHQASRRLSTRRQFAALKTPSRAPSRICVVLITRFTITKHEMMHLVGYDYRNDLNFMQMRVESNKANKLRTINQAKENSCLTQRAKSSITNASAHSTEPKQTSSPEVLNTHCLTQRAKAAKQKAQHNPPSQRTFITRGP